MQKIPATLYISQSVEALVCAGAKKAKLVLLLEPGNAQEEEGSYYILECISLIFVCCVLEYDSSSLFFFHQLYLTGPCVHFGGLNYMHYNDSRLFY